MKKTTNFSSILESYKTSMEIAGTYANEYKRSIIMFSFSFIFQAIALMLFIPLFISMFDIQMQSNTMLFWFTLMLMFSLFSFVFKWKGHDFDHSGTIVDITHELRKNLGETLRKISLEKLSSFKTGDLNLTLSSNVDDAVLPMGFVTSILLNIFIFPLSVVFILLFIDYRFTLIILLFLPLYYPLYLSLRRIRMKEEQQVNSANSKLESDFIEYIQGLFVLKSMNKAGKNAKGLEKSIMNVQRVQKEGQNKSIISHILGDILIDIFLLGILYIGFLFIEESSLNIFFLGVLIFILIRLRESVSFVGIVQILDVMNSSFSRIKKILNLPIMENRKNNNISQDIPKNLNIDIDIVDLNFSYQKSNKKALSNINIRIPHGKITALVGDSGSGKTTLTKMILRYADPQQGCIKIANIDIKDIEYEKLLEKITVVFQDIYLFDDTIINNIKMGKDLSDEKVYEASKKALSHEFIINLPNGYQTKVGDIGGRLSGGEKQRISIARAILKDAPIIILDEPTSSLDLQNELKIQKALVELVKNKTVIIITHRLSTIVDADNIIVLEDGKIENQGTHEELIKTNQNYLNMIQSQNQIKKWKN